MNDDILRRNQIILQAHHKVHRNIDPVVYSVRYGNILGKQQERNQILIVNVLVVICEKIKWFWAPIFSQVSAPTIVVSLLRDDAQRRILSHKDGPRICFMQKPALLLSSSSLTWCCYYLELPAVHQLQEVSKYTQRRASKDIVRHVMHLRVCVECERRGVVAYVNIRKCGICTRIVVIIIMPPIGCVLCSVNDPILLLPATSRQNSERDRELDPSS